ncbi:MAG: type II secretion system minor pseudopilin GspJ [Betaproteobacteria bacterium]
MNTLRKGAHGAGFTLVEVLLALAIFGVIAVLAYRATASLTDGEVRLSAEAARWRALEGFFTRFESDIRQAVPRASRTGNGIEPPWLALPADGAGNAALVFTRAGTEFTDDPGMSGQRIGYRLRGHAVEIAYWPQLDNPANVQPSVYTLATGVTAFRVEYLGLSGAWRERWPQPDNADLPRAVRVNLTLDGGEVIERWFVLR